MSAKQLDYKLIALDAVNGKLVLIDPNDYSTKILIDKGEATPDGIVYNPNDKMLYWTNMGKDFNAQDGFIEHCDLEGGNRGLTVEVGGTHTPKQIGLDCDTNYLYWCDREGMKIERCNIKTKKVEILLDTKNMFSGENIEDNYCVGIALDIQNSRIFWTMKGPTKGGTGRLLYAPFAYKDPNAVINPSGIKILYKNLPEPIDLFIDYKNDFLYWSDRGAGSDGNSINRIKLSTLSGKEVVINGFKEIIGFIVDPNHKNAYAADLSGCVYKVDLQTKEKTVILQSKKTGFTGLSTIKL